MKGMVVMKTAIIGSRNLIINISTCIPKETTEIVTVKSVGINSCVEKYANTHMIPKLVLSPISKYNKPTNILKYYNIAVNISDQVVIICNEYSPETQYVIRQCSILQKKHSIYFYLLSNTAYKSQFYKNTYT